MEPSQWTRFKPQQPPVQIAQPRQKVNVKQVVGLIAVFLGTLSLAVGTLIAFGLPIFLIVLGGAFIAIGSALGYTKDK